MRPVLTTGISDATPAGVSGVDVLNRATVDSYLTENKTTQNLKIRSCEVPVSLISLEALRSSASGCWLLEGVRLLMGSQQHSPVILKPPLSLRSD